MKRIFSILTIAGVAVMMATSAFGQNAGPRQGGQQGQGGAGGQRQGGGGGGIGMRGMNNPEMAKKLQAIQTKIFKQIGLSGDQVKKIEALEKARQEEGKKMFEQMQKDRAAGKQGDQDGMRAKFQEFAKKFNEDMVKIMGKEKFDQYQKLMRAEMQKLRQEMEKNGGGAGGQRQGGGKAGGGTGGQRQGGGGGKAGGGAKSGGGI